jgi:hypothetical protein
MKMFKVLMTMVVVLVFSSAAQARGRGGGLHSSRGKTHYAGSGGSAHVRGHVTKKGTCVEPHRRTNPDHSRMNNWSTKGNVNPYTGLKGTKSPKAK